MAVRSSMLRLVLAPWALVGVASAAQPPANLDQRYPAGSITTEAGAEQALVDADAGQRTIDAQYKAENARCAHVVLVTECQDKARRAHTLGQSQVHRVQIEAHDLQRKLAAQQRAAQRDADQVQLQHQDAARPAKERAAQQAAQQRTDQAEERTQQALRQQAQAPANRQAYEQRNAQHERDVAQQSSVQIRNSAENARRYKEKQDNAKAYAATRAREREQSQKDREERERKRKAQMAADAPAPPDAPTAMPAKPAADPGQ
jgi:colicin import membrane protein